MREQVSKYRAKTVPEINEDLAKMQAEELEFHIQRLTFTAKALEADRHGGTKKPRDEQSYTIITECMERMDARLAEIQSASKKEAGK